jgi:uncharacterized protein (TIGR02217 family)
MTFIEKRIPIDAAPGVGSSVMFKTTIKQLRGGGEYRNRLWQNPLRTFTVSYNARSRGRIEDEILTLIMETGGSYAAFRGRDWSDYQATDEPVGVIDGSTYYYRLSKSYGASVARRIYKPDAPTVTVKADGVLVDQETYFIDSVNGVVVFASKPAIGSVITWSGEFDVPIRFGDDAISTIMQVQDIGAVGVVGLMEVRIREAVDTDEYDAMIAFLGTFDKTDFLTMFDVLEYHVNTKWGLTQ